MSRIYVATSWRNPYQETVVQTLRNQGHAVYDFKNPGRGLKGFAWEDIGLDPKAISAVDYRHAILTHPRAAQGYMADMRAMEWADTCVLVLPSGRSAHLEGGWFAGRGKRLVIFTQDGEEPELMALMAHDIVVSYQELITALEEPWTRHRTLP